MARVGGVGGVLVLEGWTAVVGACAAGDGG
jgi:hypothetical protein